MKSYHGIILAYGGFMISEYETKRLIESEKYKVTANPIQRNIINKLPNTGKKRKKNTHLKRSKKRK